MSTNLPVKNDDQSLEASSNVFEFLKRACVDPRLDIDKLERLIAMQERLLANQRKQDFDDAMNRLQAKLPHIEKHGKGKNNRYALYEDVDVIIKPLLAEEGFSLSFDEVERTAQTVKFSLEVSRAGHSKMHYLTLSTDRASANRDGKSIRPAIQDDGSTASYARRYLIKLALNIVERGDDTDGIAEQPITDDQVKDLLSLMDEVKADRARFLAFMQVETVEMILKKDYAKAINALEVKRRRK